MNIFYGIPKVLPKPGEGSYYVDKKPLQVTPQDIRPVGAEVPEAFGWKKARSMLALGMLRFIPSRLPEPPKAIAKTPDLDAKDGAGPSPVAVEASKPGADLPAKPAAKTHGKAKTASTQ